MDLLRCRSHDLAFSRTPLEKYHYLCEKSVIVFFTASKTSKDLSEAGHGGYRNVKVNRVVGGIHMLYVD